MRTSIFFMVILLGLSTTSLAQTPERLCVADPDKMPASWQPSPELEKSLNHTPWSQAEAKDAEYAKRTGIDEMLSLYKEKPSAVKNMFDDSVASLLQMTYASANEPELDAKIRDAARDNLTALLTPYLERKPETAECDEFEDLLPLAIFAHRLYPDGHELTNVVTTRVNSAFGACGTLKTATENILQKVRTDNQAPEEYIDLLEDLFDLYAWALLLIEAELYPDIELPKDARTFGDRAWAYFEDLALPGAGKFEKGAKDVRFVTLADLATHLTHIPSGLGRFPIYVSDKPDLYSFTRENFYPMMQTGDRDLFSLFVDTLRQYGCNAKNDVQVRDGTRYLLTDFHKRNDKWMNYSEKRKTFTDPIEYIKIHHVWTALLGIRDRKLERPKPGTYGALVRRWLPYPD